jgi:hypothetical protein
MIGPQIIRFSFVSARCILRSIDAVIESGRARQRKKRLASKLLHIPPSESTGRQFFHRKERTMLQIRTSQERGTGDHGWLQSKHSFSFAGYHDPLHMGFGPLRVINEDRVAQNMGFGTHGHRDMEIISYVIDGALEHKDSMGTGSVLHYGDVQRMSAGSGVRHSEFNHSATDGLHFLQIWIEPNVTGIAPSYAETHFDVASKTGRLRLIASPDGRDGSVQIHQNASIYASIPPMCWNTRWRRAGWVMCMWCAARCWSTASRWAAAMH